MPMNLAMFMFISYVIGVIAGIGLCSFLCQTGRIDLQVLDQWKKQTEWRMSRPKGKS